MRFLYLALMMVGLCGCGSNQKISVQPVNADPATQSTDSASKPVTESKQATAKNNQPPIAQSTPQAPKSNMPTSTAKPVQVKTSVESTASTPTRTFTSEEMRPVTSSKSTGKCTWNVVEQSDSWAFANIDKETLMQHGVEGVMSIENDEVKVIRLDGTRNTDFEGYIRLKLQNNDRITIPTKYKKKLRIIIIKKPQSMRRDPTKPSLSVDIQQDSNANLYELTNNEFGNGQYTYQYIPVFADKGDKVVSKKAILSVYESTNAVDIKPGTKLKIAGKSFEIKQVRAYDPKDNNGRYSSPSQKYFTTIVLQSDDPAMGQGLFGNLVLSNNTYEQGVMTTIDSEGNIVKKKFDPKVGYYYNGSENMMSSQLMIIGGDPSKKEIYMATGVNTKHISKASFTASSMVRASLDNIPLD